MNKKARNQLIAFIAGILMIVVGAALFMSKTSISSPFLKPDGSWSWWKILLILLLLIAGIVLMIVKPRWRASKYVALGGALLIIIVIIASLTIIIEKKIEIYEWIIYGMLVFFGMILALFALFSNRRR